MLTKEECFDSVQYLFEHAHKCSNCVHVNIGCDECEQDNTMECDIAHYRLTCLIENYYEIFNPQPYKFEDLKELIGKPIFDYKYKEFYILAEVKEEELYKDEGLEKFMVCSDKKGLMRVFFEEGRFFSVTKALEYQK